MFSCSATHELTASKLLRAFDKVELLGPLVLNLFAFLEKLSLDEQVAWHSHNCKNNVTSLDMSGQLAANRQTFNILYSTLSLSS